MTPYYQDSWLTAVNKALAYLDDGSHKRPGDLSIIAAIATLRSLRTALADESTDDPNDEYGVNVEDREP